MGISCYYGILDTILEDNNILGKKFNGKNVKFNNKIPILTLSAL